MAVAVTEIPRQISLEHSVTFTTDIGRVLIQQKGAVKRLSTFLIEDGLVRWDMIEKREDAPLQSLSSYAIGLRFWDHLPNPCVNDVIENANRILKRVNNLSCEPNRS